MKGYCGVAMRVIANEKLMHNSCSIFIKAPMDKIFAMTSDIIRWPALLPHYRWVRWLSGGPDQGILHMAALRGVIPISWVSEFQRDQAVPRLIFYHLRAFTKGMKVCWNYSQEEGGVRVSREQIGSR